MRTRASLAVVLSMSTLTMADDLAMLETFERETGGALPKGWKTDDASWSVSNGALRGAALDAQATLLFGDLEERDVALEAKVRFIEARDPARWVALLVREGGSEAPGMQFTLRRDMTRSNVLELAARRLESNGGGWRVFQTAAASKEPGNRDEHYLRIEARGDWITAYFDCEKVFESPRAAEVNASGRIGIRIDGCVVEVDNVKVLRLDPLPPDQAPRLRTHPLVIAHRGFSHRAPENTLVAYREAIEAGADMAECDVWLSADRVPVLLHDEHLKRTTGVDAKVTSLPLERIKEFDAGQWKAPEYAGERIPTLIETLKLVSGKLRLVIEVKPAGMEREVIAAIVEAGVKPSDVMIFSFKHEVVETLARLEPQLPTTWLIGDMPWQREKRRETLALALSARVSAIGLPVARVDPAIVRLAHESGLSVFVWTVNDPDDMAYLARIGVDGIITDRPDLLLHTLENGVAASF